MIKKTFDHQIGGDHYKGGAIEPAVYIHSQGLSFFEGSVVKYVTRHARKNGAEDLRKAIHYLEMILDLEYGEPAEKPEAPVLPEDTVRAVRVDTIVHAIDDFMQHHDGVYLWDTRTLDEPWDVFARGRFNLWQLGEIVEQALNPPPPEPERREPTPEERAASYAEIARQNAEVAENCRLRRLASEAKRARSRQHLTMVRRPGEITEFISHNTIDLGDTPWTFPDVQ